MSGLFDLIQVYYLEHYRDGFQPDYWIWTQHGEVELNVNTRNDSNSSEHVHHDDQIEAMNQMVYDAFRPYGVFSHVNDNIEVEEYTEDEFPNEDAKRFYDKLISFNKPIYILTSRELQRDLRPDELFLKTHKRKNGEWVDSRAASTYKTFKEKFDAELQPTEEGNGEVVQVLDGERVNQLWTEAAGGRNRGRVYGAADLAINLKRGSKSFTQQSQTPQHSMFGMSLEAERAARIRAEQIAEAATTQLQEANEAMRAATEAAKAATETAQRMEREMNAWKEFMMKKFDTSTFVSHSHHYDDDLDDQSLDEN
ncbi:uncharacterized protein LOC127094493 [Lathyrus oleraceus]|uniref:uncharacterized protein LOC127094493 n=1 Tax=Pisum sativum TaxID=3888 RepID=UPI0021CF3525|nr:uncharacterized protein LOC127094493 [Pisum sativum]